MILKKKLKLSVFKSLISQQDIMIQDGDRKKNYCEEVWIYRRRPTDTFPN